MDTTECCPVLMILSSITYKTLVGWPTKVVSVIEDIGDMPIQMLSWAR